MHRWHYVKGVPGRLVGHPEQGSERRFIGKQKKDQETIEALIKSQGGLGLDDLYSDIDELVKAPACGWAKDKACRCLVCAAVAESELQRLADPVVAHSPAHAREQLKPAHAVAKPSKPKDGDK
jgi:hypothetical protein